MTEEPKCTCTGEDATTFEADCLFHTDPDVEPEMLDKPDELRRTVTPEVPDGGNVTMDEPEDDTEGVDVVSVQCRCACNHKGLTKYPENCGVCGRRLCTLCTMVSGECSSHEGNGVCGATLELEQAQVAAREKEQEEQDAHTEEVAARSTRR